MTDLFPLLAACALVALDWLIAGSALRDARRENARLRDRVALLEDEALASALADHSRRIRS